MGYSHCVVQHHCVKLDPPVSLTSLAEWRVSVSLVTFARYFPSRVLVTLVSCMWERPTVVNSAIASLGPSGKASLPNVASLPSLPAARLLLNAVNAVYRLLLNVSDVSLFLTRASRTSGITFSAAVHDCSS